MLLQRTPYNKDNAADFARKAALRGYMVVVQDVRGRYTSEGEWYPFKHETDDGYDTVEWAAALPHSNGKVGMFGGSYVGATQMLAAIGHPPHLAGICPVVTASELPRKLDLPGRRIRAVVQRVVDLRPGAGHRQPRHPAENQRRGRQHGSAAQALSRLQHSARPRDGASLTRTLAPYFLDWLAHPTLRQLLEAVVHRGELRTTSRFPR